MADILIIDDDHEIPGVISYYANQMGYNTMAAHSISEGIKSCRYIPFDLIFLDVMLPDGNGLESLPVFKQVDSKPDVIIITGVGDAAGAELAINNGAWDYLQKPFSGQEIKLQLLRVFEFRNNKTASSKVALKRDKIIGSSPQYQNVLEKVASCSASNANVLLTGETGTGKELFARTIHENSGREDSPFITVDCAALPDMLVESILFGHVKGAFTGADSNRDGLIKQADGGTLFLDEIGELSLQVQKNFLRALQERRFRPVGSDKEIESNFRLISATNRDLDELVLNGGFRKDLLFRLKTVHIDLPPLRSRPADIKDLMHHFIFCLCEKNNMRIKGYVPEYLELMTQYNWPGNVRELINTIEKSIVADPESPTLYPMHLPVNIRIRHAQYSVDNKKKNTSNTEKAVSLSNPFADYHAVFEQNPLMKDFRDQIVRDAERAYLAHLMKITGSNIQKAIEISGLSQSRLYTLLRQYGISSKK